MALKTHASDPMTSLTLLALPSPSMPNLGLLAGVQTHQAHHHLGEFALNVPSA